MEKEPSRNSNLGVGAVLRIALYGLLALVGGYILLGFVDPAGSRIWLPFLIVLLGIFSLPKTGGLSILPSIVLIVVGLFLLARYFGLISVPWLRYGLGGSLVAIAVIGLVNERRHRPL